MAIELGKQVMAGIEEWMRPGGQTELSDCIQSGPSMDQQDSSERSAG